MRMSGGVKEELKVEDIDGSEKATKIAKIPCPFVYAKGKHCTGHIVGVEAYKADIGWSFKNGKWKFYHGEPRSHYHLFCSERATMQATGAPTATR